MLYGSLQKKIGVLKARHGWKKKMNPLGNQLTTRVWSLRGGLNLHHVAAAHCHVSLPI